MDVGGRVAGFLIFHQNVDFCDDCLARAVGAPSAEVRTAAKQLARSAAILRDQWRCHECGGQGPVTRALANRTLALNHRSRTGRTAG